YQNAFGDFYALNKAGTNTSRAIELKVIGDTLKVKINRRIDYDKDNDGQPDNEVTVPIKIVGVDKVGLKNEEKRTEITINVTIVNNDVTIRLDELEEKGLASQAFTSHTGYTLSKGDADNEFVLNIRATIDDGEYVSGRYYASRRTFDVIRWLYDEDFTNAIKDTESYRIEANADENENKYLTYGKTLDVYDANDPNNVLATLQPVFSSDKADHFTGFTLTAKSYDRGHKGVAYLRIFDRSGDSEYSTVGVKIRIIIEIGNTAPSVKPDMSNTVNPTVYGSDSKVPAVMTFNISNYVEDKNSTDGADMVGKSDTHIRITDIFTEMAEEIYSTAEDGNSDSVLTTELVEDDPLLFRVRPLKGFYGKQTVRITVADGVYADNDTESVTFSIVFEVIYDFEEIAALNEISAVRGMPEIVSTDTLIKALPNTATGNGGGGSGSGGATTSAADGMETFNPGMNYVVTGLSVPTSYASFVSVQAPTDSDPNWKFTPKKVTTPGQKISLNVEFTQSTEVDNAQAKKYAKTFD
ncbi:MAG: hypothetical protein K2M48_04075, partial [Clostridiales bacterium]|nr:hypothetical protein [Clostridiales bacterium]